MGRVVLKQPISISILTITLVLFLVVFIYFLSTTKYARKETVNGFLVPDKGIVRIHSNRSGVIEHILVREGDRVEAGDLLVQIRNSESLTSGVELSGELVTQTFEQIQALKEQTAALKQLHDTNIVSLKSQVRQLTNSKNVLQNTIETNGKKLALAENQYIKSKSLYTNGHLSKTSLDLKQQNLLDAQSNLNSSERVKLQAEIEISNLQSKLEQLPLSQKVELSNLEIQISMLRVKLLQLQNQYEFVEKAPEAGYVTGIRVHSGSRIVNERPILSIIPVDADLLIELLLPSRSIGFVELGNRVNVRFDAFPYQKFGFHGATITHIDDAVLLPNDTTSPIQLNHAAYRIQARLDEQAVSAYGKQFELKAGMLAQGDIILEERTVFEWLMEPLYSIKGTL
jgi:membrane fusion protein